MSPTPASSRTTERPPSKGLHRHRERDDLRLQLYRVREELAAERTETERLTRLVNHLDRLLEIHNQAYGAPDA